jgi:hypothetical protein
MLYCFRLLPFLPYIDGKKREIFTPGHFEGSHPRFMHSCLCRSIEPSVFMYTDQMATLTFLQYPISEAKKKNNKETLHLL